MRTVSITKSLVAAVTNGIAQSQSLASAGTLTLNGTLVTAGVANLGSQRRVVITSAGNDSARKATVVGTADSGARSEIITLGSAAAVVSVNDFLTVGTVSIDGTIASTVTVGTNGTGSTDWIMPNFHLTPFDVTINTELSGAATYNVETTQDNYFDARPTVTTVNVYQVLQGNTASTEAVLNTAVRGYRYTITAGTGTLTAQSTQSGIVNY